LLRSVQGDGYRPSLTALATGVGLLLLWLGWFLIGRVPVHAVSGEARLVVSEEAHPVAAPLGGGRISAIHMELGQAVRAGEVLLELESDEQRLLILESNARRTGLTAQRVALTGQLQAEQEAHRREQEVARLALGEAKLKHQAADESARLAETEQERTRGLLDKGLSSEAESQRADVGAREQRMQAEAQKLVADRESADALALGSARRARLQELRRDLADIEGRLAAEEALHARLEYELERRKIRAPVTGRVGEVASLGVGAQLQGGERLGSVVPPGELKVLAYFPPSEAVGRIRQGQTARVRLDGFPWTQYGMIEARVSRVASEVRDGRIRVECAVAPDPSSPIPVQHGLTGAVEIEVERTSPAILVLRAAGMRLTAAEAR
jgi:membrane fusion protein (multidrug efflux system)